AGSLVGIVAGWLLAKAAIGIVTNVSPTFYGLASSAHSLVTDYSFAAEAFAVGIIGSMLAAWLPARAAANLEPAAALHNIETIKHGRFARVLRLTLGVIFVLTGLLLTEFSPSAAGARYQLFYVLLIQLGMILLVPKIIEYGEIGRA